MANYNFKKDILIAKKTEKEVSELLWKHYGWETSHISRTKGYDLYLMKPDGAIRKVEVKEDFTCERTGNVGIEFSYRGKPSGISTSIASHYVYKIHTPEGKIDFRSIRTKLLKSIIQRGLFHRIVVGGDAGSHSMNFLFRYDVFCKYSLKLFSEKV